MTDSPDPAALTATAARVIAREAQALTRLAGDLPDGFARACEILLAARGRAIVSGMGKSGHIARKIAATLRLHRHARAFRPPGRGEPRRSGHGDAGRRGAGAVQLRRDAGAGRPRRPYPPLRHPADRHGRRATEHAARRPTWRCCCPTRPRPAGPGIVPTTSTTMTLALGDALARGADGAPPVHAGTFPHLPPRRQAGRAAGARSAT